MLAPELTLASGALSPSLSSGKLNSITHSRDREKQKTQSSEENPLPSARRLHMSPSTSVRLFFFLFFLVIRFFHTSRRRREDDSGIRIEYFHETRFFFTMEMDGIFDIVSIHQFPRHLFMALFMRRIGQERNEFLCLCGRLRMMMILPHVSSLIFPETGPALSPLHSPAHNRRRSRRRTLHGVLLPRHSFPFHSTSHFYESNMFQ